MDELLLEYLEDLKDVASSEDERFPDFLFNFISNDFGDNYYKRGLAESPLLRDAKRIRRKYNDFFDWSDAMEVYHEYMDILAEKYGSVKTVKLSAKEGMLDEYVPPKPRLKNTKKNRMLAESGIMPSRQVTDTPDMDTILKYSRIAFPEATGVGLTDEELDKKIPKEYRKVFADISEQLAGQTRRKNMYRASQNAEIDFILDFINNANSGNFSGRSFEDIDDRPLSELLEEHIMETSLPPELLEAYLSPNTRVLKNARLVSRDDETQVEIMTMLYDMGVDIFNAYGKNMSKTAVKMVRSAVGDHGPMTKKEKKKAKKRAKEEKKRLANKRNNDALLERTLLRNRYSFSTEGNALSWRMSDLIK